MYELFLDDVFLAKSAAPFYKAHGGWCCGTLFIQDPNSTSKYFGYIQKEQY